MNRFLYAEGNPWSMVDPSGHASFYEGEGCGPGGKYCGSHGNDQNFHKNIKQVVAKAHNDYVHHPKVRMYDPQSTPSVSSEWASGDTWGENTSVGSASATETASQAAAKHCISTRGGQFCQSAQEQADGAATVAGIGDAFGDIWNSALHLGSCAGNTLNCADVALGLGLMVINPIGTGQAIGTQRAADITSGDKRAGAHAITSTLIDAFGLALAPFGGEASEVADATEITQGIYEFPDALAGGKTYVGSSGDITARLLRHLRSGKLSPQDFANVRRTYVPGGRAAREVAEQQRIDDLGGIENLSNRINVIGPRFDGLMQTFTSLNEYLDYLMFHQ